MTLHSSGYDLIIGAGTADGHLLEGIRALKATRGGTYVFGDDRIDFRLPTDIFDTSHYLLARGIGFSGVRHDFDTVAFAGVTSIEYNSPFFNGAKMGDATAVLFLKRRLARRWLLYSDSVISKHSKTLIEALQWFPAPKMAVSLAAGVGASHPYGAVSLSIDRPRYDLQAAYIAAGQAFHRIANPSQALAEPDRENIAITIRPFSHLLLTGSHQNYLVPLTTGSSFLGSVATLNSLNARSAIDQGSTSVHLFRTQLNATIYHSSYDQPAATDKAAAISRQSSAFLALASGEIISSNHAAAFSIDRDLFRRVHWNGSYLVSRPKGSSGTESALSTFSEPVTSRISMNQVVTYSNGHTSVNFGGQFISNTLSLSATYDTFYVPAENSQPFEQALLIDVKFKVLGKLLLHGASFVDPTGHIRYTADANTIFSHDRAPRPIEKVSMGRYVLHGCVLDSEGKPVEGAAVMIDEAPLFTDSNGCFQMRENTARTHRMRVVMSEFLVGGNWQVVTMPTTVTSTTEDESHEMRVIVVIRRVRELSDNRESPPNPLERPNQPPSTPATQPTPAGEHEDFH